MQAHAISEHKSQGQTLPHIVISHMKRSGANGECWVRTGKTKGWVYTAVSRTKTRQGLSLHLNELPWDQMKESRLDVLAEMARLRILHEQTRLVVLGTPATAAQDAARVVAAQTAHLAAERAFLNARR